jgi:NHL repeat
LLISNAGRLAISAFAAVAVLAACGAPSLPVSNAAAASHRVTPATHRDRGPSWMSPDAKQTALLYVSDLQTDDVYAYSYPGGTLEGKLTGFSEPWGLCVDRKGDVFVTDHNALTIVEYAHGGTTPLATLVDTNQQPGGCDVDPLTGNLAVANVSTPGSDPGNVGIYKKARGARLTRKDPAISYYQYCGYDNHGNLYVDGQKNGAFAFAELARNHRAFTNVSLDQSIGYGGSVQWDGKHIAVGDYNANVIYRFDINGKAGTKVGATPLGSASYAVQVWIHRAVVVGANATEGSVMYWQYPAGGAPLKTIGGLDQPWGVTISP